MLLCVFHYGTFCRCMYSTNGATLFLCPFQGHYPFLQHGNWYANKWHVWWVSNMRVLLHTIPFHSIPICCSTSFYLLSLFCSMSFSPEHKPAHQHLIPCSDRNSDDKRCETMVYSLNL